MDNVRYLHQHVAGLDDLGLIADGELELATLDVGDLAVWVAVELALRTLLELHLDHHHVVIVAHDLAINFAWVTGALPFLVSIEDEWRALLGDVAGIDSLTIISYGDYTVRSRGKGAVGAAWLVTGNFLWLVALASYEQSGKGSCEKNLFHNLLEVLVDK